MLLPLVWLARRVPRSAWLLWAGAGTAWALVAAQPILAQRLPQALEGRDVWVQGRIDGIPAVGDGSVRFFLAVEAITDADLTAAPSRIRLSSRLVNVQPRAGERWRLRVRLKRPRGFANPGGFDYEAWLFRQRVGATGYVREHPGNLRLAVAAPSSLDALRQRLVERLDRRLGERPLKGLLIALATGHRDRIDPVHWERLIATGTNHLLAISGLHVGLVAGFAFLLGRWGAVVIPRLLLALPAQQLGAAAALLAALVYAALAGFSVPTQRALIMLAAGLGGLLLRRELAPSQWYGLALLLVLLWDPLAVLEAGFWLSFAAVGIIALMMSGWRRTRTGRLHSFTRLQLAIGFGLIPLLLFQFGQFSVVGPLANLLAVPVVGLLVTPLTLLGAAADASGLELSVGLLATAHRLLEWTWRWLGLLQSLPFSRWYHPQQPPWLMAAGFAAALWLIAARGLPGRGAALATLLALALAAPARPAPGALWLTLLDVGQGLAVVLRTANHAMVYDTGPRLGPRFDTGSAVLLPFLRAQGIGHLDLLLVSHGDNDHIGGSASLLAGMAVKEVRSSVPDRLPAAGNCEEGQAWEWDGVAFRLLNPRSGQGGRDNDRSCVLHVISRHGRVLLPGDIEAAAEWRLVNRYGAGLSADVLVAPHHGSRSSSSLLFVEAVAPAVVLYPVGHRNRYGHPQREVVDRYRRLGAGGYDTASSGAITLRLEGGPQQPPERYRPRARRYWSAR